MNAKRIALVLVTMVMVSSAAELPDTLAAYRGKYEGLVGELDGRRDAAIGKAVAVYRRELETLLANVRQQGDLDYVTAIQGELDRTKADPSAPEDPAPKRMKHLRRAQWGARQAEDKAGEAHAAGLAKLDADYLTCLEGLEKRLVAANQIEVAKAVRAERAIVEARVPKAETQAKNVVEEKVLPPAKLEVKGPGKNETALFKNGGLPHLKYTRRWVDVPAACAGWAHVRTMPEHDPKVHLVCRESGTVYMAVAHDNVKVCERNGWRETGMGAAVAVKTRWRHEYRIMAMEVREGARIRFPKGMKGEGIAVFLLPVVSH